jgi:thiamine biosynthesis protein ThiI
VDNLAVVDNVATMPILRPLVGMDKEEITADAQRIGTYGISIVEDEDCCTLFTPRFPTTRASIGEVEAAERALDLSALIDSAVQAAAVEDFGFPVLESRAFAKKEGPE